MPISIGFYIDFFGTLCYNIRHLSYYGIRGSICD